MKWKQYHCNAHFRDSVLILLTSCALKCSENEMMTLVKKAKNSFSSVSVMLPFEKG